MRLCILLPGLSATFACGSSLHARLFDLSRPAAAADLQLAREFVDGFGAGGGVPLSIHRPLAVAGAVRTFERIIDAPLLGDVSVRRDTLKTAVVYPVTAPDLFAARPLVVHGRYAGMLPRRPALALRGAVGTQSVTVPISVTPTDERADMLAGLWTCARVDELEQTRTADEDPGARRGPYARPLPRPGHRGRRRLDDDRHDLLHVCPASARLAELPRSVLLR